MKIEEVVGVNIAERREALGLSQAELGDLLGNYLEKPWPRQAISAAEKGRRAFAVAELVALALALRTEISELLLPGVLQAEDRRIELPGASVPLDKYLPLIETGDPTEFVRQADLRTLKALIPSLKTQSWTTNVLYQTLRDIYLSEEVREQDQAEERERRSQTAEVMEQAELFREAIKDINKFHRDHGTALPAEPEK